MLSFEEYSSRDGLGIASLIRSGEVAATEVQHTAIELAKKVGPLLGAFTEGPFDNAQPANSAGEFAGVPFVIKDLLITAAGVPSHNGSGALADGIVPEGDSILMSRFRNAGLALVGSSKAAEFGLSIATDQKWGGPARNPWDLSRSPGGSSGGSAALVAAGVIPIAHANDGAGSIRIPAAHCGLVGLKPSRGRIPLGPGQQELMYGNAVEFVVTRTVRDAMLVLDVTHGNCPGEKYGAPPPLRSYWEDMEDSTSQPLRIAVSSDGWYDEQCHPDVRAAIEETAEALTQLGHTVEEAQPAVDWEGLLSALTTTWCAGTAAAVVPLLKAGVAHELFEATTLTCAEAGQLLGPVQLAEAFDLNNAASRAMGTFFKEWDVWVTPTAMGPAPDVGAVHTDSPNYTAEQWVHRCVVPYPTCAISNVTGGPAISLPLAQTTDGLPVGVQLSADLYREDVLARISAQLEHVLSWHSRKPRVHATGMKVAQ